MTIGSVRACEYTRMLDTVLVTVDADFTTFGGVGTTRAPAWALPFTPAGTVGKALGSGWVLDANPNHLRGGGANWGGPVSGYQLAGIIDMATGAAARVVVNGTFTAELAYRTADPSDTAQP
jgi:hypothetical protein